MIQDGRPRLDKKVLELVAHLRDLALQKGPEAKLPTTRELCVLLKTNSATLNEALKELEQQNIIYRKQKSGIFVSPKLHRKTICVLFFSRLFKAEALSPFWTMLWAQFGQEMTTRNAEGNQYYSFYLVPESAGKEAGPEDLPEIVTELILAKRVHGVLAVGMEHAVYKWLVQQEIPSVTFAGIGSLIVVIYDEQAARMAIDDLVARGCHTIGVWVPSIGPIGPYEEIPAYQGWKQRLTELQMPLHEELFRWGELDPMGDPYNYYQQGYQLARAVFTAPTRLKPDGLFITNDLMTAGALLAFDQLGIQLGRDINLVSMANTGSPVLASAATGALTLVEIDVRELVQKMFSLMKKALDEHSFSSFEKYTLTPSLHHRNRSTLPYT